jgi:hypothetical protein
LPHQCPRSTTGWTPLPLPLPLICGGLRRHSASVEPEDECGGRKAANKQKRQQGWAVTFGLRRSGQARCSSTGDSLDGHARGGMLRSWHPSKPGLPAQTASPARANRGCEAGRVRNSSIAARSRWRRWQWAARSRAQVELEPYSWPHPPPHSQPACPSSIKSRRIATEGQRTDRPVEYEAISPAATARYAAPRLRPRQSAACGTVIAACSRVSRSTSSRDSFDGLPRFAGGCVIRSPKPRAAVRRGAQQRQGDSGP